MSLEQELKIEQVTHLDLTGFCMVTSGTAVQDALTQMRHKNVNVCMVTAGEQLAGIFTDRDVLGRVASHPELLVQPIDAVMTPDPITIGPETSAAAALWLMDAKGIRNLPVVDEDGRVLGAMTHQAVIRYLAARYPIEVQNRPPHPEQFPRKPEGGD
ncbi:MAG TPA: CBS domain-containing protein [Chloroflexota bacterium]|nr:CBS domain-containing protein [Chloroflexota bacterium]